MGRKKEQDDRATSQVICKVALWWLLCRLARWVMGHFQERLTSRAFVQEEFVIYQVWGNLLTTRYLFTYQLVVRIGMLQGFNPLLQLLS